MPNQCAIEKVVVDWREMSTCVLGGRRERDGEEYRGEAWSGGLGELIRRIINSNLSRTPSLSG